MTDEEKTELVALKQKLRAREGRPGWAENCEALRQRIAELENGD